MSVQADQLNAKIRQLGYRWHARETSISRLSTEDKRRLTGILISREEALERRKFYDQEKANARSEGETCVYPSSWDWRDVNGHDYTTPAKSQQPCPACSVFAGLAVIESTYMIAWKRRGSIFLPPGMYPWWKPDKPKPCPSYDLSEADLWFCGNVGNCDHTQVCEKGWTLEDMLTWVLLNGVVCESTYAWSPSTTNRNQCPITDRSSQRATRISDFRLLTTDCQAKEWIASYGPVLTCMIPYEDFGYYSGEEVYTPVLDDGQNAYGPMGVHAVCLVGYNESGKYWIGKNSWGQDWGDKGFFKVGYEGLCEVGRCIGGYYGVGVKIPPLFIRRDRLPWIRRIIDVLPKESQFE